jgi:hypothetical protein
MKQERDAAGGYSFPSVHSLRHFTLGGIIIPAADSRSTHADILLEGTYRA